MDPSKITTEIIALLRATNVKECIEQANEYEALITPKTNIFLDQFITVHPEMLKMKEQIKKLAHEDIDDPVLIIGETGTGKELIANALHNGRTGKFVSINCAGMPEQLIESELFGHVKGSFTDAKSDKKGLFEEAEDGTMFLDEIGELSFGIQNKLLRVIQEKKLRRVGGNTTINISCRFVSATNKNIDTDKQGFRQDLFWRISTFILRPLPLRERLDDIPLILKTLDKENKFPEAHTMHTAEFSKYYNGLSGNVRSLQQIVRRYYVLGELP